MTMHRAKSALLVALLVLVISEAIPGTFLVSGAHSSGDPSGIGFVKYTLFLYNNTLVPGNYNKSAPSSVLSGYSPWAILYDPVNGYLYVGNEAQGVSDLIVVNTTSNSIVKKINVRFYTVNPPEGLGYDPADGYVYVAVASNGYNLLSVVDPSTNSVVANITVGYYPSGIAYDPSNGYLYVADTASSEVSVINPSTNSVVGNIRMGTSPNGIVYDPMTGFLYVTTSNNSVLVIDPNSGSVIAAIRVGYNPIGITYDPQNGYIYVANSNSNSVSVIDPYNDSVVATVQVGKTPMDLVFDPKNGYIYVTDCMSNSVSVIDPNNNSVIGTIPVGVNPIGITYDPQNGYIYVANAGSATISIIATPNSSNASTQQHNSVTFIPVDFPDNLEWTLEIFSVIYLNNGREEVSLAYYNTSVGNTPVTVLLPTGNYTYFAYVGNETISGSFYLNSNITIYLYYSAPSHIAELNITNIIPYLHTSWYTGAIYVNFTRAELGLMMPAGPMLGNLSTPGVYIPNDQSYFNYVIAGPFIVNTTVNGWSVYGFTFITLPTYGNGTVVNATYKLQKTLIIAYNSNQVIALLYYRSYAPVPLLLNQYWSHIHKGTDGLNWAIWPSDFNPYLPPSPGLATQAYYLHGNTSVYINGSYVGQLNSFGLWEVLPVGPILLVNNMSMWNVSIVPMDNLSSTPQIQLVTNGFSINSTQVDNSLFSIQHGAITLYPGQAAQYVYAIGINAAPPSYQEIESVLPSLIALANNYSNSSTTNTTNHEFRITFIEEGLPAGTPWYVYINGTEYLSTSSELNVTLPQGIYVYSAGTEEAGFAPLNPSGVINLKDNTEIVIRFAPTSSPQSLKIYSEYVKYFYSPIPAIAVSYYVKAASAGTSSVLFNFVSGALEGLGLNEPNVFYVEAPEVAGAQPTQVYGYIEVYYHGKSFDLLPVNFSYNPSVGMWQSNTINMAILPAGNESLVVVADYPGGTTLVGKYPIYVILLPPFVTVPIMSDLSLGLLGSNSTNNHAGETSNETSTKQINIEFSFTPMRTGLVNNTYVLDLGFGITIPTKPVHVHAKYISGNYSFGALSIFINAEFSSNGNVEISAKGRVFHFSGEIMSIGFTIADSVKASGVLQVDYNNLTTELEYVDIGNKLSAYIYKTLPTPWGIAIKKGIYIGFVVTISGGLNVNINVHLTYTNVKSEELLGIIPLKADSVRGHIFIPVNVMGTVGASFQIGGSGVGLGWFLGGSIGIGEYFEAYPTLSAKGGAIVGEVYTGGYVKLVAITEVIKIPLLGPGVIAKWGNVTSSELAQLNSQLNQFTSSTINQATGEDWVNGQTFGIVAGDLPTGYSFTTATYNGLEYVYYTVQEPDGNAWIDGSVFNGSYEYPAPLPSFDDLGVASPYLIATQGGNLMMVWFAVPKGAYALNNLTIVLQGSTLTPSGSWSEPFNITTSGVALSVTSDGRYLYVIWEPSLNLNYSNAELVVYTLSGQRVTEMPLPGAVALNGASNGSAVVQFLNGTYALVNPFTGRVVLYPGYTEVGYYDGLFFTFVNGTLTLANGTSTLTVRVPDEAYAWPTQSNGNLFIIGYRPGVLTVYEWNGSTLLTIGNYPMLNLTVVKPVYSNYTLYVTSMTASANGTATLWNVIDYIPPATHNTTTTTSTTSTYAPPPPPPGGLPNYVGSPGPSVPIVPAVVLAVLVVALAVVIVLMRRKK